LSKINYDDDDDDDDDEDASQALLATVDGARLKIKNIYRKKYCQQLEHASALFASQQLEHASALFAGQLWFC